MIRYTQGNLLEADAQALVNTVNTVGVMGKGIALMFKESFPENFKRYAQACAAKEVEVGQVFATKRAALRGPQWIVNFPTKKHWRHPSKFEWIVDGLADLRRLIEQENISSIAIPPLGSGNGGLRWPEVRAAIEAELGGLDSVEVVIYEPTSRYQNVAKPKGVQKLTPARALVAEMVRRYWILGIPCSLLEIQKLAWFLERFILRDGLINPLNLNFQAHRYGPYTNKLEHLLNALDGSYLHCERRIADARPSDAIYFKDSERAKVETYLQGSEAEEFRPALAATSELIDGFESPLGMELLATVDWL